MTLKMQLKVQKLCPFLKILTFLKANQWTRLNPLVGHTSDVFHHGPLSLHREQTPPSVSNLYIKNHL